MYQFNQENTAGRIQPSRFDTVLPPEVQAELLRPRRARILTRPPPPPQKPSWLAYARSWRYPALGWLLALAGVIGVAAIIGLSWPSPEKLAAARQESVGASRTAEEKATEAMKALRASSPAPIAQPTPAREPVSQPPVPPPPAVSAPRARLVLYKRWAGNGVWEVIDSTGRTVKILVDPAPRAQLVQLREWQPGTELTMRMPYDESFEVRGVFKGSLSDQRFLPQTNNIIGDTWVVGRTPWVWVTVPGTSAPTWVDP